MERYITKEIRDVGILIGKAIEKSHDNDIEEHLNHTQIQILIYLVKHRNEEVCQKDLEAETHLKKASITGTLDSLEDKGMIIRKQSDEDKRKNIIVLSEKATNIKKEIIETFKSVNKRTKQNITEEELNQFYNVIDKIKKNLK